MHAGQYRVQRPETLRELQIGRESELLFQSDAGVSITALTKFQIILRFEPRMSGQWHQAQAFYTSDKSRRTAPHP